MEARIRDMVLEDLPWVVATAHRTLSERYRPSLFTDILARWPRGCLIAEASGRRVGFLMGALYGSEARVLMVAVVEEFRRRGIGTALMEEFERRAKESGAQRITLEVRTSNDGAIRLYRRLGYRVVGTLISYYADGSDAFLMEKVLEH
ncbi:MAG: ribosomal-protein-alanine N-acetyltransferase [Thermoplasmata archaeon]|nr:MAG: ribosomal-protein-alanine N-acetyltransferase [Thermoplasmata archaeon]HDJ26692.1 ribosomal-protein-alanine N-acetyltransferase [Aciduliprofundum sp.]